jgi:hypothetical protein
MAPNAPSREADRLNRRPCRLYKTEGLGCADDGANVPSQRASHLGRPGSCWANDVACASWAVPSMHVPAVAQSR